MWRCAAALALVVLQGCESGSGGSDVGGYTQLPPTARPQVLNAGVDNTFREGSEVLLTGKASEDADGPLLYWRWRQTAGPAVRLVERNKTTVSFTAPDVSTATPLQFDLTVEDSHGKTSSANVGVTVVPAQDPNRFLALDVRGSAPNRLHRFKVIPALANGTTTGAVPLPFTLSVVAHLVYPPRSAPNADCQIDLSALNGTLPAQTSGGCLIAPLANLTPTAGVAGQWPANISAATAPPSSTVGDLNTKWWNPQLEFEIPRLDAADFNQQFVESDDRTRMLDLHNAHRSRIVLALSLAAPSNPSAPALFVTGTSSASIDLPIASFANPGNGLPVTGLLDVQDVTAGIAGHESALTGNVYYRTVDPQNTRLTLNAWLQRAGFASDAAGTLRPEAVNGTGEFAHAVYLNNYDLGFGRDMYTRTDSFGNVYAFVVNYGTLEGAIRRLDSIATVVMEYSPLLNAADSTPKFTKFFTYVDNRSGDSPRVTSMNFDGRGEISTPGNCVICHGGSKPPGAGEMFIPSCGNRSDLQCYAWPAQNADGDNIANGNLNAGFLPWDLESLLFADDDPAITAAPVPFDGVTLEQELRRDFGDRSRGAQEAQLKRLNQAAYRTYCNSALVPNCPTDAARRLVEHWYQGVNSTGSLVGNFSDASAPSGWRNGEVVAAPTSGNPSAVAVNPNTAEDLYQSVYAQNCRVCHTNIRDSNLRFDTYWKLLVQQPRLRTVVFEQGLMPAARLTADRFWVNFHGGGETAAERLAEELGVGGQLGPAPLALITGAPQTAARNEVVRLFGRESAFANTFRWSATYTPPIELLGNPSVAGFAPTLVGESSSELSFAAAKPGTYSVALAINGTGGPTAAPVQIAVPNFAPSLSNIPVMLSEGGSQQVNVLSALNGGCTVANCPAVFGDAPFTIAVNTSGWLPQNGLLTVNDATTGTITIQATQPVPSPSTPITAAIPFTVTDVDGEARSASINVTIAQLTAPVAGTGTGFMNAQTTVNPPGTQTRIFSPLTFPGTSGATGALPLSVNSFTNASNGTVTRNGNQLTYRPNLGFVGNDSFQYSVIDSNPTGSRVSANATITVSVQASSTFSVSVRSALAPTTGAGCTQSGCHSSGSTIPPDWNVYANFVARTNGSNARASFVLTCPRPGTQVCPAGGSHPGGVISSWVEGDSDFNAVLRWIEEGRRNN